MNNLNEELLQKMKEVDIKTVDPDTLVDIKEVNINMNLPREERVNKFLNQIKNPYCYKCGKAVVKISFDDTTVTLEDRMKSYLKSLKE